MEYAYITDQWGKLRVRNVTLSICAPIRHFLLIFIKKFCFCHFHFLFCWSIKVPQQNINQSYTRTGGKNSSVDLLSIFFRKLNIRYTYYPKATFVLKNFAMFICVGVSFNKVSRVEPWSIFKRDSNAGAFLCRHVT